MSSTTKSTNGNQKLTQQVTGFSERAGYGAFGCVGNHVTWTWWILTVCGMTIVPFVIYWCWICVETNQGVMIFPKEYTLEGIKTWILVTIGGPVIEKAYPTAEAWTVYLIWVTAQAFLFRFAPGHEQYGVVLGTGKRMKYCFNGQFSFYTTMIVVAFLHASGLWKITNLYRLFPNLLSVCILFTSIACGLIYLKARLTGTIENQTDSILYDYFMGPQLNPTIFGFDLKFFFELRPGIMHWFFTSLAFAFKQYEENGTISVNMALICFYHLCFVNACYKGEHCVIWSMDIIHEKFGWMLMMLDIVMVPFVFPFQTFYVYKLGMYAHPTWYTILVASMHCIGYFIFDTANSQKDYFREKPEEAVPSGFPRLPFGRVKNPRYIQTERGTKLLVDGWWKYARHMNYFGDILMSWSWGLTCGTGSYIPYAYTTYLTPLLIHRELRDDLVCADKYGKDWEKYKKLVPYRIIPYVY